MDENKKEQFNRIDELLKDTSAENRIKFNEDEAIDILSEQEDKPAELEEAVVSGIEFNALQIVLMCVVGVALLWCIVFTTDHTIAAQGYSPVFCVQTQSYEDGSASFKGLGYKIQFRFDSSGNLTQKCVPAWKDGPNDIADKQESGASFQ